MQVRVKLMGTLRKKTPPGGVLELSDDATVGHAIDALNIARDRVQVVTVNGDLQRDYTVSLNADDELTILAPVGGG